MIARRGNWGDGAARRGTALVPTLMTYHVLFTEGYPAAGLQPGGYFHDPHCSFPISTEGNLEVVRKAHEAGIPIGVGTDMGFAGEKYYPSAYFVEMSLLKEAGLGDHELLQSATRVGAEILGMEDRLGTLQRGKLADVIVVRENPLDGVDNLKTELVIADGKIVSGVGVD